MFQVVVLPPPDAVRGIEEFRRLHDPAFHRVAAHLPLVPPFEVLGRDLLQRFDALELVPPFDVALGAPTAFGRSLALPLSRGEVHYEELRRSTSAALLPTLADPPFLAPALRVGFFGGDAEMELARRVLGTLPPPGDFAVHEVTLLLEDERGLWHGVRTRRLPTSA